MIQRPTEWQGSVCWLVRPSLNGYGYCRCCNRPVAAAPTSFGPGTQGKIEVLTERESRGQCLWHPGDAALAIGDNRVGRPGVGKEEEKAKGPVGGPVDLTDWFEGEVG